MTQNAEQNVRTRREQLSAYPETVCVGQYPGKSWQLELNSDDLDPDRLVEGPVLYVRCDIAHRSQTAAEDRGAEEQRWKDAEGQEPVAWNYYDEEDDDGRGGWRYSNSKPSSRYEDVHPLYTRPVNVAALEARAKKLESAVNAVLAHETAWRDLLAQVPKDSEGYVFHEQEAFQRDMRLLRATLTREGGV